MLSRRTRLITRGTAVAFLVLGLALLVAPAWAAERFPWGVTPFVAMTIGGWCLGTATAAWIGSRAGPVTSVLPVLAYVWAFGAAELLVAVAFRSKLQRDVLLAPLYIGALAAALLSAVAGLIDLVRLRAIAQVADGPSAAPTAPESTPGPIRLALAGLAVFVALLVIGGLLAGAIGASTSGKIFPQPISLFTVRAFAAFYLALFVGLLVVVVRPTRTATVAFGVVGLALIVPILGAALLNLAEFDFVGRPLGLLYLGAYVVVLVPTVPFLWRNRAAIA